MKIPNTHKSMLSWKHIKLPALAAVLSTVFLAHNDVEAAIISTFTDRAAFEAASDIQTVIDFGTPSGSGVEWQGNSHAESGVTFSLTDDSNRLFLVDGSQYNTGHDGLYLNHNNVDNADMVITVAPGTTAVGFDIGYIFNWGGSPSPGEMQLLLDTGETVDVFAGLSQLAFNPNLGSGEFFGFTTDSPFTSFRIMDDSNGVAIDNFAFGTASVVPEPSTYAMFVMGCVGIFLLRRYKLLS